MDPSIWTVVVLFSGCAYCASLGDRFPHWRFYSAELNIAAVPDHAIDLWHKSAPHYNVHEQMTQSPWPSGSGDQPAAGVRPAWAAYIAIVTLAIVTIVMDAGTVNIAAHRLFSFETMALVGAAASAIGVIAYLRTVGPRYSLRILLAVITVLAAILALVIRH